MCVCLHGFPLGYPVTFQNMPVGQLAMLHFPLGLNKCVNKYMHGALQWTGSSVYPRFTVSAPGID